MNAKLANSLFFMRITIGAVLLVWTFDKFINVEHATAVYEKFYFIPGLSQTAMLVIGGAELVLVALFLVGRFKNITYLIVLIIHAVSTLTPMMKYFDPYSGSNLLFFAAWPMLAACWALYSLREYDTKFTL
jgi:hypothetical protein